MFKLFKQYYSARVVFLFLTETLLITGVLFASVYIRYSGDSFSVENVIHQRFFLLETLLVVGIGQLCFYYNDLYDLTVVRRHSDLLLRLTQALAIWCLLLVAVSLFSSPWEPIERETLLLTVLLTTLTIWLWREGSGRLGFLFKKRERVLILGSGQVGIKLCRKVLARVDLNFEVVGFLDEDPRRVGERLVNPSIIGTIDELVDIVQKKAVNRVIVSLPDRRGRMPVDDLLQLRLQGVRVEDAHTLYESVTGRISLDQLDPSWLIFSNGFNKFRWQLFAKRCIDLVFALALLTGALPFMAVIAILIKLDSEGPVFFRQERIGQNGKKFTLLKFRTMNEDAEGGGVPQWATENDARVTRLGGYLRKFRFDELPQAFNIIRGDMSFVGPRPERPYFVDKLEQTLPYYRERHLVKPGLTGWAQIRFPYASTEQEAREKMEYDLFYVKNFSVLFDLAIVFETVKIVLFGRGAR
jgi:sugar transferase (PEP-CTERM system associated)